MAQHGTSEASAASATTGSYGSADPPALSSPTTVCKGKMQIVQKEICILAASWLWLRSGKLFVQFVVFVHRGVNMSLRSFTVVGCLFFALVATSIFACTDSGRSPSAGSEYRGDSSLHQQTDGGIRLLD